MSDNVFIKQLGWDFSYQEAAGRGLGKMDFPSHHGQSPKSQVTPRHLVLPYGWDVRWGKAGRPKPKVL